MREEFSMINKTRYKMPRLPFVELKEDILGQDYSLSLAFISAQESQAINSKFRSKNNPTNVLSFSLGKRSGEILICPAVLKKEIKEGKFDRDFRGLLGFLVIHGMLHLKGHTHSSTMKRVSMEEAEQKYDKKYFSRNRRRLGENKGRGGRIHKRRKAS